MTILPPAAVSKAKDGVKDLIATALLPGAGATAATDRAVEVTAKALGLSTEDARALVTNWVAESVKSGP